MNLNCIILYVDDVDKSTKFYETILETKPLETFHNFTRFLLNESFTLGLQSKHDIDPKPQQSFGGFELCLSHAENKEVDLIYQNWKNKAIKIEMEPTNLIFGYTFVALDPDGHRIRISATDTTNVK